jgi:protein-S-isoprenylcysteine O-methyltransferase Ste14
MTDKNIVVGILWIAYCLVHSLLAATAFKKRIENFSGRAYKFYRLFYNIFATATLVLIIIYQLSFSSPVLFITNLFIQIIGGIVTTGGFVIMSICIANYFMQESGLLWLNPDNTKPKNKLIITGIHKIVRHPLYLGTFIFIWGLFILFPYLSVLITDIIITVYTLIAIKFEENKLEKEFSESYKEYKRHVPMILPKI